MISSSSVRLSRRYAEEIHQFLVKRDAPLMVRYGLEVALRAKPKRSVVAHRKVVRAKKATKREETSQIRAAVFARAKGACDYCVPRGMGPPNEPTDWEHPLGRRYSSAFETLAVCRPCHEARTRLEGGAVYWWGVIVNAFARHQLWAAARKAKTILRKHIVKAEFAESRKVRHV